MTHFYTLFLGVFFLVSYSYGHDGSHEYSLDIEVIRSGEDVHKAISYYSRLRSYHPEAKEHFRDALLERDDVEAYFTRKLDELPQTLYNGKDRNLYFRRLSTIRTPWAAKLCGKYLLSEEKVEMPDIRTEEEARKFFAEDGGTLGANSDYALRALEIMDIDTAPTQYGKPSPIKGLTKKELWREWWIENEENIEELLAGEFVKESSKANKEGSVKRKTIGEGQEDQGKSEKKSEIEEQSYLPQIIERVLLVVIFLAGAYVVLKLRNRKQKERK